MKILNFLGSLAFLVEAKTNFSRPVRTSESWKRKKDKPEEKTEISEIDARRHPGN